MANWEMWDQLSEVTPDYDYTLNIRPTSNLDEEGDKNQDVLTADDNSDTVITISSTSVFYVDLVFEDIEEEDAGTIMDLYHDPSKANARARSFKWTHYGEKSDQHTYTVKFADRPKRSVSAPHRYDVKNVKLKIIGRAPAS